MAHNKLLDYMSKETMLSDTREFRRFIREAVIKFDEENCSEEVEETLQAIADQREYEQEARMEIMVLCQDLAQNKMRSFATKLLTENRPSHTFFQSR